MSQHKLISAILLTLVFVMSSLAQDEPTATEDKNPKTTILIDEFGRQGDCELSARVDNLFIQLNDNQGAKGYVIAYKGTDFLPSQIKSSPMIAAIRRQMAFRRYDDSRIVIIDGGFRETITTQFYLVPGGAEPPEPTDTISAPEAPKGTFLWSTLWLPEDLQDFDEFILPSVKAKRAEEERLAELEQSDESGSNDSNDVSSDSASAEPVSDEVEAISEEELTPQEIHELKFAWIDEAFGEEIAKRKKSYGVMIFYADDEYHDIAKVREFIEEGRNVIAATAGLSKNRIQVVFGGYRDSPFVEFYIVSNGGKTPEPKPEQRPVETPDEP